MMAPAQTINYASTSRRSQVDVGIPTLDRRVLLAGAVRSILDGTHDDFSVFIADNASSDGTPNLVRGMADNRIFLTSQSRTIPRTYNYNVALQGGRAPYVALLADDDEWLPDFLESALSVFRADSTVAIVHTGYEYIDLAGVHLHTVEAPAPNGEARASGKTYIEWLLGGRLAFEFTATLMRRSALPRMGFLPDDDVADDIGLLLRTAVGGSVAFVNRPLVRVRIHPDSVTANGSVLPVTERYWVGLDYRRQSRDAKLRFLSEHGAALGDKRAMRRLAQRALRRNLLVPAARALRRPVDIRTAFRAVVSDTSLDRRALIDSESWKWAVAAYLGR
jgi:glycosyltransferase involved in cell wall biosynthesis